MQGDAAFDLNGTATSPDLPFTRSAYATDHAGVQAPVSLESHYIDASMVHPNASVESPPPAI
jgi:hypothetical protein